MRTTVAAQLAPPLVTVGEPAALVTRVTPATAATLTVQRLVGTSWTTIATATSSPSGRLVTPLDSTVAGSQSLRVLLPASRARARTASPTVTFTVTDGTTCTPTVPLVDRLAVPAARCLAARLDRWKSGGVMGVGQQLNVSNSAYLAPLDALGGRRTSVVGFDLAELAAGQTYQFPVAPLDALVALARRGTVLSASWHPDNPHTQQRSWDRSWTSLDALLDPGTAEGERFWGDYDTVLDLLRQLQDAGVAVVFRPLHEANGDWFWWGRPHATTYKSIWKMMQTRAAGAGVHNVVWAYSFNAVTGKHVADPVSLLPASVDVAGIDSYDPEVGAAGDALPLQGYAAVAARVKRMAITEAGPYDSTTGAWSPSTLSTAARAQRSKPIWSMLWFDDYPGTSPRHLRQISSLRGGLTWLDTCPNGFCSTR